MFDDTYFMKMALKEAMKAYEADEVPIGAVVVMENKIIGRGYNQVERLKDATAHAEMIAITSASEFLGGKYLNHASLYVTLEPCMMCSGAIYWSRIEKLIYGAPDEKYGGIKKNPQMKKKVVLGGILEEECTGILRKFFEEKR